VKEIENMIVDINRCNDGVYSIGDSGRGEITRTNFRQTSDPFSRPPNQPLPTSTSGTRTGNFRRIVSRDLQADFLKLFYRILATWRQGKLEKIGYFRFLSVNSRNTAEILGNFAKVLKSQFFQKTFPPSPQNRQT
jgi:hypothetical protein